MLDPDRHTAPLSAAELTVFNQVLELFRTHAVPHGRAVYMFGSITQGLIAYAVREHSVPEPEALNDYLRLFTSGLGIEMVRIEHEPMHADTAPKPH